MTTSLPEVSAEGLVLWRVRRSPDVQVWCSVRSDAGGLVLTLHDPGKTRKEVTKSYAHIGSLVESAERVRGRLVAAGWQMVDVDLGRTGLTRRIHKSSQ